jgi:hypothetical protein
MSNSYICALEEEARDPFIIHYLQLRNIIAAKINMVLVKEPGLSMAKCLSLRQPYAEFSSIMQENN